MTGKIDVIISEKMLDIPAILDFVSDPACGAVATFIGTVRNEHQGRDVVGISYDVFEPLVQSVLRKICEKVRDAHNNKINICIAHYKGRLDVGGVSVVIAVSAPHRAESFDACRALIEQLKQQAPVWKQEHYADGDSAWLKGHDLTLNDKKAVHG
jgi:molybdopterin synthase catalytic subunit